MTIAANSGRITAMAEPYIKTYYRETLHENMERSALDSDID